MATKPKKYKILIVDDDPELRKALMEGLDQRGYLVQVAESAEDASILLQDRPNIVILDVLLPKMNGFEFCKRIKESKMGKNIPIILMTGVYKKHFHQKEAKLHYGASDYLIKPVSLDKLEEVISIHLGVVERSEVTASGLGFKGHGTLQLVPIEKLLNNIGTSGKTGRLHIKKGNMVREFFFHKGFLVYAKSNIRGDSFSQILLDKKKITEDQKKQIDIQSQKKNVPREKIAFMMKIISKDEVYRYVEKIIQTMVFSILRWKTGEYQLFLKETPPVGAPIVKVDTKKLVIQGILKIVRK